MHFNKATVTAAITPNEDQEDVESRPYTIAPKMAQSNEFYLTEIPLDTKNGSDFAETTDRKQRVLSNDIKMPNVEDGLSSSSELSCCNSFTGDDKEPQMVGQNTKEDTILNSNVIRDITQDIEDLRRTITDSKSLSFHSNSQTDQDRPFSSCGAGNVGNTGSDEHYRYHYISNNCKMDTYDRLAKEASQLSLRNQSTKNDKMGLKVNKEYESDEDTDKLLTKPYEHNHKIDIPELKADKQLECERKKRGKEVAIRHPDYPSSPVEGLIFRANYLGSTQLMSDSKLSRDSRMLQAQEAVGRVKAPDSESQPSVGVELFISTEKILILNTNLTEIMMDHNLKSISYIADIGNILVLMARRIPETDQSNINRSISVHHNKIICHVFESEEAQLIAQTIGNAFQVAYIEFLKANGIDDPKLFKEVDYQDVLNDQEIVGDELKLFSSIEEQKEVIVPKQKSEPLGVVIVESGWGSMIPTVVLANMNPTGPAARCGLLNIGNQIISVNGTSLVGLPLSNCQQIIKKCKNQTAVKLVIVSCPPVVEVNIRRPDPKYQLGFSVQNGVICSLLRGGIAERGGVRVGHHIIEINGLSVVAMTHERIVNLLATSYGEIHLRTMPSSIFRLLTGQETPHYI